MEVSLNEHSGLQHVVALQQISDQKIRYYVRENGKILLQETEFFPFFFLSHAKYLDGFPRHYWLKELQGTNHYRFLAAFSRWNDLWEAIRYIIQDYNKTASTRISSYTESDLILLRPDPINQYLLQSGNTLFKGMDFQDLHRMQIRILTLAKSAKESDPRKTDDRIGAIALGDNRDWFMLLDGKKLSEPELLIRLKELILERDPDIIESTDLMGYELPYILKRCELHQIDFSVGRDGSSPKTTYLKKSGVEHDSENVSFEISGRHLITLLDIIDTGESQKKTAGHLSPALLAEYAGYQGSTPPELERVSSIRELDLKAVTQYFRSQIELIRILSDLTLPTHVHLAQICPLSFSALIHGAGIAKIESLVMREYIRAKYSIPKPSLGSQPSQTLNEVYRTGVIDNILHVSLDFLFPQLMLQMQLSPKNDQAGIFLPLIQELIARYKSSQDQRDQKKEPNPSPIHGHLLRAYRRVFTQLYPCLTNARSLFRDPDLADRLLTEAKTITELVVRQIDLFNGQPVELDNEHLFFSLPNNVHSDDQMENLVGRISERLPYNLSLSPQDRFKKMLVFKPRVHALLDNNQRVHMKGSSLTTKNQERFLRSFIEQSISLILKEDFATLHWLYVSIAKRILSHRWTAADFCKTETFHISLEMYDAEIKRGERKQSAAYEASRRAGIIPERGARAAFYATGSSAGIKLVDHSKLADEWDPNFPDENTLYYLDRLSDAAKKFETLYSPEDFSRIFSTEEFIDFKPKKVRLLTNIPLNPMQILGLSHDQSPELGIWLDDSTT
ncbi:MAG: hypothetical protein V1799_02285 [bacterium]